MRVFLPLGYNEELGHGEQPGTFAYFVTGNKVKAVQLKKQWGFPIGDVSGSAYSLTELEDPEFFVEVSLEES